MSLGKSSLKFIKQAESKISFKRFFINNLDSYQGRYILKEIGKILVKEEEELKVLVPEIQPDVENEESISPVAEPIPIQPYEIFGTLIDPAELKNLRHVTKVISKESKECLPAMLTCGTVILDISYDQSEVPLVAEYLELLKHLLEAEVLKQIQETVENQDDGISPPKEEITRRKLILISTPMTWALTKPLDPDTPDMPFVETDFRKRKPHPNYKPHFNCENAVIEIARKYVSLIGATVVNTGVTYGGNEDVLYYWFQKAWECEPILPIFGRGTNAIPLINVADLASIVYNLVMDFPKKLYIFAVEQAISKQREIIKAIGKTAGTGMFKCLPLEKAFIFPEITQRIFELMTLNLYMEPTFIVETMNLQWASELPFSENVPAIMKQFKKDRNLKPFKVLIYGPPIVGKTTLAKKICENYGLMYISRETVVEDLIKELTWRIEHWEKGETAEMPALGEDEDDDEPEVEDEEARENARTTLALLQSGQPPTDEEIIKYLRERLLCQEAQNKGWVIDNFPTTIEECTQLFEKGEETDSISEEEPKEEEPFDEDAELYTNVLKKLLPDIVVSLEATDEFICEKAINLPVDAPYIDEATILKRLRQFRKEDTVELSPMNFFDELDIHPFIVPVNNLKDMAMEDAYFEVSLRMGRPCRYAKLMALIEAEEAKRTKEQEKQRFEEEKRLQELERKMQEEREEKMEYWSELYALMREEEEAALAAAGEPMRNYLVHHIFPTLTPALLELAKIRPDDPIDFLAEYLFKLNPTGKMLEPGYNLQAEKLLGKIKILDDALQDLDIQIEPLMPPEAVDESKLDENKYSFTDMGAF